MPSLIRVISRRALLCGCFLALYSLSFADTPKTVNLTILHTNDTHGHLMPYSYPETADADSEVAHLVSRKNIGGAARRATLVKKIRAEKGHDTLLLDAGDICDGTPFSIEYHGDADIAAMNAIGYDLACPGNHEFNNTVDQLIKLRSDAHFPILCANARFKSPDKPVYLPYIIKEIGGAKIAFFGLTTYDARTYTAAKDSMNMQEPIEAAKKLVPELRKQADLVVAITHIGFDVDQRMAYDVPGIDVIVGGHTHTMLSQPLYIASSVISDSLIKPTIIVQNYQWAGTLGRLDLTLQRAENGTWSIPKYHGALLPITSTIPEDPKVAQVVSTYWGPIKSKYAAVIGEATDDFASKGPDYAEYNFVADAVREQMGTEFDLENQGGVRAPLTKGTITYQDMATLDPFGNTLVTFKVTGRQLKEILAKGRPGVSGIRYTMSGNTLTEATINGKPIEDDRVYAGATNSYLASQPIMKDVADKVDTKKPRLEALIAYIKAHKTISPSYDSRRLLKSAN
jgi:5'-nucleotidase/UDP-sugar diphosphatase